jgi:hypothetical protein
MTDLVPRRKGRKVVAPEIRFRAKVDQRGPDDCWLWTAGCTNGYGSFRIAAGNVTSAHGYAKKLATGVDCPPGMHPLHTCKTPDSPICCNPDHIIYAAPGTTTITLRGIAHPRTKLTDADVREIRRRARAGERNVDLAREFGVGQQYVSNLKCGWRRAGERVERVAQ